MAATMEQFTSQAAQLIHSACCGFGMSDIVAESEVAVVDNLALNPQALMNSLVGIVL